MLETSIFAPERFSADFESNFASSIDFGLNAGPEVELDPDSAGALLLEACGVDVDEDGSDEPEHAKRKADMITTTAINAIAFIHFVIFKTLFFMHIILKGFSIEASRLTGMHNKTAVFEGECTQNSNHFHNIEPSGELF